MRSVVALRHVAFEDLGVLAPVLAARGYALRYMEPAIALDEGAAMAADLLVILGGPIGVYEDARYPFLSRERSLIARRLAQDRPVLGICLGAQLMAQALGAQVVPSGRVEIGYAPLLLTAEGRASALRCLDAVPVLHWHGDQFDLPPGALCLAQTPGFPNQAFSLGPRVLGLQFHLEAEAEKIEHWLVGHAHELSAHGIDPRALRAQAAHHGAALADAAGRVLSHWLAAL